MNEYIKKVKASLKRIDDFETRKKELAEVIKSEKDLVVKTIQNGWYYLESDHKEYLDEVSSLFPDEDLEKIINVFKEAPKIVRHHNAKNIYYLANSIEGVFFRSYKLEFYTVQAIVDFIATNTEKEVKLSTNREKITIGDRVFGVWLEKRNYDYKYWVVRNFWEIKW